MAWNITERFPSWGESGEFPSAGFFYEGGDQVNEKHLDALWNGINGLEEDVQSALNDIDSNADGKVDNAEAVDGNSFSDIQTWVNNNADVPNADYADSAGDANTVDGEHASAFADTNHGNEEHSTDFTTLTEVNNNADVPNADYADNAGDADTLDGLDSSQFASAAITFVDQARFFNGNDGENVSTDSGAVVNNNSIELTGVRSGTFTDDTGFGSECNYAGLVFDTDNLEGSWEITATVDADRNVSVDEVRVERQSNGNVLASTSVSSPGDTVTLSNISLDPSTTYRVVGNNAVSTDLVKRGNAVGTTDVGPATFTDGIIDGTLDGDAYVFSSVEVTYQGALSGNATISWSYPEDVYDWDLATIQKTLDGETVTVDIEDGGGSTLISNIGRNVDLSSISTGTNLQFDVSLSRSNTSNNPSLDYVARQYVR